jgi:hypothetical protein
MSDTDNEKDDEGTKDLLNVGQLREFIAESVKSAVAGLGGEKKEDSGEGKKDLSGGDITQQVQRELARVREHERRTQREKDIDTTLAALQERTKEKPPVERRRVHKFMGWGD